MGGQGNIPSEFIFLSLGLDNNDQTGKFFLKKKRVLFQSAVSLLIFDILDISISVILNDLGKIVQ